MTTKKRENKVVIHPKIEVGEPTHERLSPEEVAAALGGEIIGRLSASDPITLLHVGVALQQRLRSTGGRPGLEGTQQSKIPVRKEDVRLLEQFAERIREQFEVPVTWTQMASVLLSLGLKQIVQSTDSLNNLSAPQVRELVESLSREDKAAR